MSWRFSIRFNHSETKRWPLYNGAPLGRSLWRFQGPYQPWDKVPPDGLAWRNGTTTLKSARPKQQGTSRGHRRDRHEPHFGGGTRHRDGKPEKGCAWIQDLAWNQLQALDMHRISGLSEVGDHLRLQITASPCLSPVKQRFQTSRCICETRAMSFVRSK